MSVFKVGDEVWFFYTGYGRSCWGNETTMIYPINTEILSGKIVNANADRDYVHVYVKDECSIVDFGYCCIENYVFKTKQEAIDAMTARLEELKSEDK